MTSPAFELATWTPALAEQIPAIAQQARQDDDGDLVKNLPAVTDEDSAAAFVRRATGAEASGTAVPRAIVDAAGRLLGQMSAGDIDTVHSTAWISYWLRAEARGQGIASAALRRFVAWLHDERGIHRLELGHRVNNPASGHVAAAAGFIREGTERERLCFDGVRYDVHRCARLTDDPR